MRGPNALFSHSSGHSSVHSIQRWKYEGERVTSLRRIMYVANHSQRPVIDNLYSALDDYLVCPISLARPGSSIRVPLLRSLFKFIQQITARTANTSTMILTYRQDYGRIIDVPYSCSRLNQKWRFQNGKRGFRSGQTVRWTWETKKTGYYCVRVQSRPRVARVAYC